MSRNHNKFGFKYTILPCTRLARRNSPLTQDALLAVHGQRTSLITRSTMCTGMSAVVRLLCMQGVRNPSGTVMPEAYFGGCPTKADLKI